MRIIVEWDDPPRTILRYTYRQHWNWKDFETAVLQARGMVNEVQPMQTTLDLIIDFTHAALFPSNAISNFERSLHSPDAIPFGVAVVILPNSFLRRMMELFRYLNPAMQKKLRSAENLDEAHTILSDIRTERDSIPS